MLDIIVAIDEIEAWFLAVPDFFKAYDETLSIEKINECLGYKLQDVPVESISHPASAIHKVLTSVGLSYKKRAGDSHKISGKLDYESLYLEKSETITALGRFSSALDSALA